MHVRIFFFFIEYRYFVIDDFPLPFREKYEKINQIAVSKEQIAVVFTATKLQEKFYNI